MYSILEYYCTVKPCALTRSSQEIRGRHRLTRLESDAYGKRDLRQQILGSH